MIATRHFRLIAFSLALCLHLPFATAWAADAAATPDAAISSLVSNAIPAAASQAGAAQSAAKDDNSKQEPAWIAPKPWFVYTVVGIVLIGSIYALLMIRTSLANSKWSLSDALSEEASVTAIKTENGAQTPMLDANQQPVTITEMRASTSRLVALLGMIVIVMMFLGFGTFALFEFAVSGNMPQSIDNVVNYLLAGLTLFAPYVANKFASMFSSLTPRR